MNDIINALLIIVSILILVKLGYNYCKNTYKNTDRNTDQNTEKKKMSNKMSKTDFYKLVTINLLPFFIYELYKEQKFYDNTHPLHCKLGEVIIVLFCYILYVEIIYPLVT